jgi:two-component system, response regulator PdtaR
MEAGGCDVAVLVVEDEFLIALEIEDVLNRNGYRVIGPAVSVEDALALLAWEQPTLAVLDVNLRGRMVAPVAAELRRRGVPFALASAYQRGAIDAHPELRGAVNIGKPTRADRLLAEVARLSGCEAPGTEGAGARTPAPWPEPSS